MSKKYPRRDPGKRASLYAVSYTHLLELYQQTNTRLWRQGQRADTVVLHHIIAEDTIDEQIMDALERKDTTQTALMNAVKAQLEV